MKRLMLAAAAVFALGACDQLTGGGSGPPLPPLQQGAVAPTQLPPPPANVQQGRIENRQDFEANIRDLLDQLQNSFPSGTAPPQGFTDRIVTMQPSTDHRFAMNLEANTNYSFIGACDGDCTNVDIEVIDTRTGGVVASDLLPDDYPITHFQPPQAGSYIVRLLMRECSLAPCFAGARVLTVPAQASAK